MVQKFEFGQIVKVKGVHNSPHMVLVGPNDESPTSPVEQRGMLIWRATWFNNDGDLRTDYFPEDILEAYNI